VWAGTADSTISKVGVVIDCTGCDAPTSLSTHQKSTRSVVNYDSMIVQYNGTSVLLRPVLGVPVLQDQIEKRLTGLLYIVLHGLLCRVCYQCTPVRVKPPRICSLGIYRSCVVPPARSLYPIELVHRQLNFGVVSEFCTRNVYGWFSTTMGITVWYE
jgi:hypothetical protein